MSKQDIETILAQYSSSGYPSHVLENYRSSIWAQKWDKSTILETMGRAFRHGFVGIHFIPKEYEGAITYILEESLGSDHYIAYRICKEHDLIVLEPNFHKLQKRPNQYIMYSYKINKKIHALRYDDEFVSFCFE